MSDSSVDLHTGRCSSTSTGCEWLKRHVTAARAKDPNVRLLAVFDIDDTLLVDTPRGGLAANPPVVDLYIHCVTHDVKVHIVTARPRRYRAATIDDLYAAGVQGPHELHMMHDHIKVDDIAAWKERIRWHAWIVNRGDRDTARLLFTVGDQWWDLLGTDETIEEAQYMYGCANHETLILTHPPGMEPAEILLKLPAPPPPHR